MISILLVEDNIEISRNIVEYFGDEFNIKAVYDGSDAIQYLDTYSYDIVILDLMLPEVDGMSVLSYMSKKH